MAGEEIPAPLVLSMRLSEVLAACGPNGVRWEGLKIVVTDFLLTLPADVRSAQIERFFGEVRELAAAGEAVGLGAPAGDGVH